MPELSYLYSTFCCSDYIFWISSLAMATQKDFFMLLMFFCYMLISNLLHQQLTAWQINTVLNILLSQEQEDDAIAAAFALGDYQLDRHEGGGKIVKRKKPKKRPRFWMSLQCVCMLHVKLILVVGYKFFLYN